MTHTNLQNRQKFVIGKRVPRFDVRKKILGEERYAGDLSKPGMLIGCAVHTPVPHGYIHNIDVESALNFPGVHAVLTASDIPGENVMSPYVIDGQPFMASDQVRSLGDVVCVIAAEDEYTARKAAGLLKLDIEPLAVIDTPEAAMKPYAVKIHPGGNIAKHVKIRHGDIDVGFSRADVVIEGTYTTPTIEHSYLEPDASLAYFDEDGTLIVQVGSQGINDERHNIANGLGLPPERIRVIQPPMGGAFGGKEETTIGFLTALLAFHTQRPVKMVWSRRDVFTLSNKRHASNVRMKTGATHDGAITAMKVEIILDTGAYAHWGPGILSFASCMAAGPYEIPNVWVDGYAVYTNNLRAGSMRGWGIPQVAFAWESQMDRLSSMLDLHPLIFRWMNAVREGSTAITGESLPPGVGLRDTIRKAAELRGIQLPELLDER
jgi:CO/xanthine dehydrogenase Mo-binding subunit